MICKKILIIGAGIHGTFIAKYLAIVIGALIAGCAIGSVLGFVGAGGAMLTVPILVYGFGYPPQQASVAAIAVVIVAAISGLYPRYKNGEVLIKEALIISALGIFANIGAAQLVRNISDDVLITGFSAVIIFGHWFADWILWNRWRILGNSSISPCL